eukprot:CAMPEP_0185732364 /NCGR_PEP_ID=MMETSP1171-20130828/15870_1 /TAXON_ID=374046 /ORGANISM="Helicotheca tamensis, Strain CCMP826" /LENGTH=234 /DNA_ID=CAMNT_0028401823 /DNA_START=217 /DNA_END=921 /DNA_ORIENTATION=-
MTMDRRRSYMSSYAKPTTPLMEVITMKVPTMGDSITEGTIVEWTVSVGQAVSEGDVVAQVETDKVTVDIKADMDGVIVEHFGEVDDTVEVGADLYKIDTEGKATVAGSYEISPTEEETSAPKPVATDVEEEAEGSYAVSPSPPSPEQSSRVPSIHFLGKEGWAARKSGKPADVPPAFTAAKKVAGGSDIVYDGSGLPSTYGRPAFSEDEMEALITGGANLAPKVVKLSGGAEFS